jgi:hypothetical protein
MARPAVSSSHGRPEFEPGSAKLSAANVPCSTSCSTSTPVHQAPDDTSTSKLRSRTYPPQILQKV